MQNCSFLSGSHSAPPLLKALWHELPSGSNVASRRHLGSARRHHRDTASARMGVGHSLLLVQLPSTHWVMICAIRRLALTVSDVCLRLICSQEYCYIQRIRGITLYVLQCTNLWLTYLFLSLVKGTLHDTLVLIRHLWLWLVSVRRGEGERQIRDPCCAVAQEWLYLDLS